MLNKTISTLLSTLLISSVLFTSQALAKGNQTTVTFKAAIVIPPCSYNVQDNNMKLKLLQSNKKIRWSQPLSTLKNRVNPLIGKS
ncbi:Uncharacterised protein [Providencia rustigianii]|nr:Uncharacterised protein [Providencia rustigianii]